ncbi:hypothetical protein DFO67_10435 [Modicisalibacter xianhensis]|uniref:Uncharacterized protein n=1 Tax=Modicisalibacter xianhensis TaxID=442341 RepID=A0A4R8FYQ3_9GAMM|nr:hypothetical protein DFO67_10435 [Halomonas xianhensis]
MTWLIGIAAYLVCSSIATVLLWAFMRGRDERRGA